MPFIRPALAATLFGALLSLLSACGGGGGGDSAAAAVAAASSAASAASPAASAASSAAPSASAAAPTPLAARLSGVAALGAPMSAARVRVLDATGALVGSTSTNAADGSYALTLLPALAPLMVQAAGTDATGQPLVLHSVVQTLTATSFANISPLSDAIVALTLGTDPKPVFAGATAKPATLAPLASSASLAAASTFLKTLVKTNLSDAKTGDATKLDLLGDSAFAANKTGVDLALETLTMSYGTSVTGSPVLQFGNKLAGTPAEVVVDLDMARTELAKTTGAKPANAITSTLKATTSPTTTIASLTALDDLVAAINKTIADGTGASTNVSIVKLLPKYTLNDGANASALADRIAGWTARKMQIGRMQVTGCADETIAKTGCVLVSVAARVSDTSGGLVENLTDAVTYNATATPKWSLVGNGQLAPIAVRPIAWLTLENDGRASVPATAASAPLPNPNLGLQLAVGSSVAAATVQTPGGYVLPMVTCSRPTLCIAAQAGDTSASPTGGLADDSVFQFSIAWLGSADLAQGARFKVTLGNGGGGNVLRTASLRSSFAAPPALARFPTIDDVKSTQALPGSALLSAGTLSWSQWAAVNPDMRLVFVRTVLSSETQPPLITDVLPKSWVSTSVQLAEPVLPVNFGVIGIELWLAAIDFAGRWHYTRYTLL